MLSMKRLLLLLFVSIFPALARTTPCESQEAPSRSQIKEAIEAYLAPLVTEDQISGAVLVAVGDDIVFEQAYGMANYEHEAENKIDTPHCIASISKGMTLVMGIRLMEQGKLPQGSTLEPWLPDFPRADRITVEDLMRHRAGLPHRVTEEQNEGVPRTAEDMVELAISKLTDDSFLCEPGATSNYSSLGYSVLARVLELASGKTYNQLLQEFVCTPAGMTNTIHIDNRTLLPGRAESYMPVSKGIRKAPLKDLSFLVGAGSVYSTAPDLLKFLTAIRKGSYGPSVKASMLDGNGIRQNGASNGFRGFADYIAKTKVSIAVTCNLTTGALDLLRNNLPRIAAGEAVSPPSAPHPEVVDIDPELLDRYEGVYEMRPGSTMLARVEGPDFIVGSYVLVPIGEDRFYSFQDYAEIQVKLSKEGEVEGLDWNGFMMRRVKAESSSRP